MTEATNQLESRWARAGILFACAPARATPDPERLLLGTARSLGSSPRLLTLVSTWLVRHGHLIARHRLRRLAATELDPGHRPALGVLIASAVDHGAPADLRASIRDCSPAQPGRPLFDVQRGDAGLAALARAYASPVSLQWGLWSPAFELAKDAVRPMAWILDHNPSYRDRLVRKGDLRCSLLEALRRDTPAGATRSESELARLTGATRAAVRNALAALLGEGEVAVSSRPGNRRDHQVSLRSAA